MTDVGAPSPLVLRVRAGEIVSSAWVYSWVNVLTGDVLYVGSTRLPPQVRTWLHLHDADPDVGRVASRHPAVLQDPYDVVAFEVPAGLGRAEVRSALVAALSVVGLLSADYVGDPPGTASATGALAQQVAGMVASITAHHRVR